MTELPYRQIHLDFHTSPFIPARETLFQQDLGPVLLPPSIPVCRTCRKLDMRLPLHDFHVDVKTDRGPGMIKKWKGYASMYHRKHIAK